jgi:hypothetical protein
LKSPPPNRTSSKQKDLPTTDKKKKSPNWASIEDTLLCRAYCTRSLDPRYGKDQPGKKLWNGVLDGFTILRTSIRSELDPHLRKVDRDVEGIKIRYTKHIAPGARKFLPFWRKIYELKPSGVPEEEYIDHAMKAWEERFKKPYPYKGCSKILKQLPTLDPTVPIPKEAAYATIDVDVDILGHDGTMTPSVAVASTKTNQTKAT